MLNITKNTTNNELTIALEGRLDTITSPQLESEIKSSIAGVEKMTLDLQNLEYISSAGLRVLLSAQKRMNDQGDMELINVGETVKEILDVTGFSDILTVK